MIIEMLSHIRINILIFLMALLLANGCYTITDTQSKNNPKVLKYLHHEILGSWYKRILVMDAPERIKLISFKADGTIEYYEDAASKNATSYWGTFYLNDDSLEIKFLNDSFSQKYKYKIDEDRLELTRLTKSDWGITPIVQDSKMIWIRNSR